MNRSNRSGRGALETTIRQGLRAFMTRSAVINQVVAERTGLNPTDLQCLGLLQLHGPMSAGALARSTGLTASAITTVIDRLERSGFAIREHHPSDRRRVIVKLDQAQLESRVLPLYAARGGKLTPVFARFSDQELTAVASFLQALEEETAALDSAEQARRSGSS
jgi:DNA-binding MarR family transcriptional regulator